MAQENGQPFDGSVAGFYEEYLVPLIFDHYANDLAKRAADLSPHDVLETAAGTGIVTRKLSALLPSASIVATDISQPMIYMARLIGTPGKVDWREVDAMHLPYEDRSFDLVVCQFGAMFFADRRLAYSEARRVLRPGGTFLFNVWDRIEENDFVNTVVDTVGGLFPANPPRFMIETPHGYHEEASIIADLATAGFTASPRIDLLSARSRAASARIPALAYCHGTPLKGEILARDPGRLDEATDASERAIARRFGNGPVEGKIQAYIVSVTR